MTYVQPNVFLFRLRVSIYVYAIKRRLMAPSAFFYSTKIIPIHVSMSLVKRMAPESAPSAIIRPDG